MQKLSVKTLILFYFFIVCQQSAPAQSVDYKLLFGADWEKAEIYERENRSWIEPVLSKNQLSYPLAVSIIFPELVRYSALRDKMEISVLKSLYVNLGDDYADFSVGVFQMKPSFAERICSEAAPLMAEWGIMFPVRSDFSDPKAFRKAILKDLEDPKRQLDYLVAFINICEINFNLDNPGDSDRVKFLATAYNYGINKTAREIEKMINKKFFNISLFKTENYSYADVALYWYKLYLSGK